MSLPEMSTSLYRTTLVGKTINRLGFGAWPIGGSTYFGGKYTGYGQVSEDDAMHTVQTALDQGIHFFDTSDAYGKGRSEEILGKVLEDNDWAVICSKFGSRETQDGKDSYTDFSANWLRKAVEESLKRLKREKIDILLMHSPPDDFNWSEFDPAPFEELQQEGKIGTYGVSIKSIYGLEPLLRHWDPPVIEGIYNILDRRIADYFTEFQKRNIHFIARMPLASGFLTDKFLGQLSAPQFHNTDIRSHFPEEMKNWMVTQVQNLSFLKHEFGSLTLSALRFCLSNDTVTACIPGMKTVDQVNELARVTDQPPFNDEVLERIRQSVPETYSGWIK